jgi:hypothetical protein
MAAFSNSGDPRSAERWTSYSAADHASSSIHALDDLDQLVRLVEPRARSQGEGRNRATPPTLGVRGGNSLKHPQTPRLEANEDVHEHGEDDGGDERENQAAGRAAVDPD